MSDTYPEVDSIWAHKNLKPRQVVSVDTELDRIEWSRPKYSPRVCTLATWLTYAKGATRVNRFPKGVSGRGMTLPAIPDEVERIDLTDKHPLLRGIIAPGPDTGVLSNLDEYVNVVGQCLTRGVTQTEIADAMGITLNQVSKVVRALRDNAAALTAPMMALRIEQQWQNANWVFNEGRRRIMLMGEDADAKDVAALLKPMNDANKRMAALTGADKAPEVAEQVHHLVAVVNPVETLKAKMGFDAEQLKRMGEYAAREITVVARKKLAEED